MLTAKLEIVALDRSFQDGLLVDISKALRELTDGERLALTGNSPNLKLDLERWSKLTGHSIVEIAEVPEGANRYVIRKGRAPRYEESHVLGERLWIYTNFDCNLACDYCCVRSSPHTPRRALTTEEITRLISEAVELGFKQVFMTGGEPFILPDIAQIINASSSSLPTTVLTNGMLFQGQRLAALESLSRDNVALQISLDSPTPQVHDLHRGQGSWAKALAGINTARKLGFRVRVAASAYTEQQLLEMNEFLQSQGIPQEDRVLRQIALRGNATTGLALARPELVPEFTVTSQGVYWHPVGATDNDFLISRKIFPLSAALEHARQMLTEDGALPKRLAQIFNCA
jgi:organic radical activating enzyme/TusA-related sulfurtransferase